MMEKVSKSPVPPWGSWLFDIDIFPSRSEKHLGHEVSFSGEPKNLKSQNIDSSLLNVTLLFKHELNALGNGSVNVANNFGSDLCSSFLESDQPCEEPWLLRSLGSNSVTIQVDETSTTFPNMRFYSTNKVEREEESEPSVSKEPVSTTILINSSVCTMQRIAVLEDGKLVELLLEPVKNIVQCDSVYFGVVTKLVPHMGGAFLDIGISRPSLMDIKPNREPFAYPPFSLKVKKREFDVSVVSEMKDHAEPILNGEDDIVLDFLQADLQDGTEQFIHEDLKGHEPGINLESFDTPKGQTIGGTVDFDGGETDFEDYFEESGHSVDGENADEFLLPEMESSNDAGQSCHMLEDFKVPNETYSDVNKWVLVKKGTKVIVQVVKEGLGTKGPALSPYPSLKSRFWVLSTRCDRIGVSKKITGVERTRLKVIAKTLQPPGFGLTVRTVAISHSVEELQKDLEGLFSTWKDIMEHAKSAALAADGVAGAVPVILRRAMGQTLSVVQDYDILKIVILSCYMQHDKYSSLVVDNTINGQF